MFKMPIANSSGSIWAKARKPIPEGTVMSFNEAEHRCLIAEWDAEYRWAEQEALDTWLAARCEIGPDYRDTAAALFASWKEWVDLKGGQISSGKQLSSRLQRNGFRPKRIGAGGTRGYQGIRLKLEEAVVVT
jgi:hypothetical protein